MANAETLVESLPVRELSEGEMCLGWKLYIPYGDQEEYEYYGAARIAPPDCKNPDNVIDREFGCYGLLSAGSGGRASFFSQNSLSLCNALAGCITMTFCDCQIFPSFTMRLLDLSNSLFLLKKVSVLPHIIGSRVCGDGFAMRGFSKGRSRKTGFASIGQQNRAIMLTR